MLGIMDAVEAVHGALVELGYPVSIVPLGPIARDSFHPATPEADVVSICLGFRRSS